MCRRFGVVCAFATESQVDQGIAELSESVRKGFQDVHAFIDTTRAWARTLLLMNYRELETSLTKQQQSNVHVVWLNLQLLTNVRFKIPKFLSLFLLFSSLLKELGKHRKEFPSWWFLLPSRNHQL